jgi:leucyl aminopeptidase
MFSFFTTDRRDAIPVTPVTAHTLPAWIERHPQSRQWLSSVGFKAAPGTFAFIPAADGRSAGILAAVSDESPVFGLAYLPTALPEGKYCIEADSVDLSATHIALGWALGSYVFDRYRKRERAPATLVLPEEADRGEVERIARAVFLARNLINTPAEDMGPEHLAQAAREVAEARSARFSVIVGDDLLRENYPTIHLVGRASARAPRLIDLTWGDEAAPKVTLVGKGVCFDTGGLDLKPRDAMLEMKKDMGGAAIVLGLADALMSAGTRIRLRVLIPAVENSVNGNAVRPRDIVRTRGGKTVEIGNTDAEGRLILCDALTEADRERPDILIDCATLTGAARVALGPQLQAMYCDDDAVALGLLEAGTRADDPLWRMPLWRPYRRELESKCADLNNVARNTFAGSIIAALYLSEFVSRGTRWVHLDVFGSNPTARPGRPEGGEATALRALYGYLRERYR